MAFGIFGGVSGLAIAAAIALAGSVAGFLLIRSRDLHVTALSAVPPEPDPEPLTSPGTGL